MTHSFFCSDISSQVGEDLIGSAPFYQTYVLVECPFPWKTDAFDSKCIPQNLRDLVNSVRQSGLPIQFLLINQEQPSCRKPPSKTPDFSELHVLTYRRPDRPNFFCQGYQRWEWTVNDLVEVAPLIQSHLLNRLEHLSLGEPCHRPIRDLFVCVHGSRDKCCAKYGFPFYREAIATIKTVKNISQLTDGSIRLWQTSHFGGHRFAPTLIDFPTGRYYGRLNQAVLRSILMQSGDLQALKAAYRGWGILPTWLQAVEEELIQRYGWQWFDCKVAYQLISQSSNPHWVQAQLSVMRSDGRIQPYAVEIVRDSCKTVCLRTSCGSAQESEQVKYKIKSLTPEFTTQGDNHNLIGYFPKRDQAGSSPTVMANGGSQRRARESL